MRILAACQAGNDAATADLLGLTLRGLTDQDRARLGVPSDVNGALVVAVEPDSAAADKGLEPGDLITRVNQKPVTSANAAVAALKTAKGKALVKRVDKILARDAVAERTEASQTLTSQSPDAGTRHR